jgi:hypothetical protein
MASGMVWSCSECSHKGFSVLPLRTVEYAATVRRCDGVTV